MVVSHPREPCMLAATLGLTQKNARIEGIPKGESRDKHPDNRCPGRGDSRSTETQCGTHFGSPGKLPTKPSLQGHRTGCNLVLWRPRKTNTAGTHPLEKYSIKILMKNI